jgi:hypothetical protein
METIETSAKNSEYENDHKRIKAKNKKSDYLNILPDIKNRVKNENEGNPSTKDFEKTPKIVKEVESISLILPDPLQDPVVSDQIDLPDLEQSSNVLDVLPSIPPPSPKFDQLTGDD